MDIVISVNVLTGILYAKSNRPQYLNFGSLGTLVAHEMNHAFDPSVETLFSNFILIFITILS